ncbi:MAG: apolipoprotein N-acyltransferase [Desulfobulbaceae bacterium]
MNKGPGVRPTLIGLALPSLASALFLAAAMPGRLGWWPLLFVGLVPLLGLAVRERPGSSAAAGLFFGLVYHLCLLYWIVFVLGRYGGLPLWLSVPALILLALYMACYPALFAWLFSRAAGGRAVISPLMLILAPCLWVGLDWLRSVLFTGFPWMDLGYGLHGVPHLIQAADLGGHHLLTFCLVLGNVLILYIWRRPHGQVRPGRGAVAPAILALALLVLIGGYSQIRLRQVESALPASLRAGVTVVQGNIAQDLKWTPEQKGATVETYCRLSAQAIAENNSSLLVWPETALPFFPGNDPLFESVTRFAREQGVWLLTGAPNFSLAGGLPGGGPEDIDYANSAILIDPEGRPAARYDKQHLVPFGEYVPLRELLFFLRPLVESVGNFKPGDRSEPLPAGSMQLAPLICYESIFPALARQSVAQGANLLVNLTNDAWYGRSSAPHHSFAMATLRAVETRRTLVRAANTGISGFITPLGRVARQGPLFEPLALSEEIPLFTGKTMFVRFGYLFAPLCLLLASTIFWLALFRR